MIGKNYSIEDFKNILKCRAYIHLPQQTITNFVFDTRKIHNFENSVFIALKGQQHNGHDFVKNAYEKGIRNFIVEDFSFTSIFPNANFLIVTNTIKALQIISKKHRNIFNYTVIGITGSNGKTIVKEWLYLLLHENFNIVKTPKSYNSKIGVPLSVFQMTESHNLGIFEVGISGENEMKCLQEIVNPNIGIFTNIGSAHKVNFKNKEKHINEKLELFQNSKIIILHDIYTDVLTIAKNKLKNTKIICWGNSSFSDYKINFNIFKNYTTIQFKKNNTSYEFKIPFTDLASIENLCHCIVTSVHLGIDVKKIQNKIKTLPRIEMRLELKKGINHSTIINDSYSNDLKSLEIALDFFMQQNQHSKKTIILSDFLQSGLSNKKIQIEVAKLLSNKKIDTLIVIGKQLAELNREIKIPSFHYFETTDHFIEKIFSFSFSNKLVLLKGARNFHFEKISNIIEEKKHETVLEINLTALEENYKYFQSKIKPQTKIMAMVKALSYGSGSYEIANLLQFQNVDYLAVAYLDEAIELRKNGIQTPLMVMSSIQNDFYNMLLFNIEPEIYSIEILESLIDVLKIYPDKNIKIHICIDTGMHRLGFKKIEIEKLISIIKEQTQIIIASIFSHLISSDNPKNDDFTKLQVTQFKIISNNIIKKIKYKPLLHILNTNGIIRFSEFQFNMVRLGIGLYGISAIKKSNQQLKMISSLKTVITQIKTIPKNHSIGYGRNTIVNKKTKIATIAIGYADGINRKMGNGNVQFWIENKPVKTIGNICMDMTMIDVTDIEVKVGQEVVIFNNTKNIITLAKQLKTIPYEILTNISQRVKRIYFQET